MKHYFLIDSGDSLRVTERGSIYLFICGNHEGYDTEEEAVEAAGDLMEEAGMKRISVVKETTRVTDVTKKTANIKIEKVGD